MTDGKLLGLAARAAGAQWTDYSDRTPDHWEIEHADGVWRPWDPLTDNGDALRLAADLDMMLTFSLAGFAQACSHDGMFDVDYGDDRTQAMRRAIVLAAAEIGRRANGGVS